MRPPSGGSWKRWIPMRWAHTPPHITVGPGRFLSDSRVPWEDASSVTRPRARGDRLEGVQGLPQSLTPRAVLPGAYEQSK